ncbi:hypothetical protein CLV30_12717 [Haloactinopolyspora alba]|uniref:Uncharacterized protein n=1 Tax=Haloactinopolyspora alba TaxID=648780 RepID=A0A2P8DFU5_9ACTN|nr:hypothetical protein [Haloactinopolyspora alba]PSK96076.1 hypothetical protein CLV30_12717 [Haloactinopolyspora alba]
MSSTHPHSPHTDSRAALPSGTARHDSDTAMSGNVAQSIYRFLVWAILGFIALTLVKTVLGN